MSSPRLQAVFFDFDGTLADTDQVHLDCWNQVLEKYQVHFDQESYSLHFAGNSTDVIAQWLIQSTPAINIPAERLGAAKDDLYEDWMRGKPTPLKPGGLELIGSLAAQGIDTAIVTGGPLGSITSTLEHYGIANSFKAFVTREDVSLGKPSPEGYLLALHRLQVSADSSLAIEDTNAGVRAAKSAGLTTCAIPHRYTRHHDFTPADIICSDMHHAANWILETFLSRQTY